MAEKGVEEQVLAMERLHYSFDILLFCSCLSYLRWQETIGSPQLTE